MPDPAPEPLPDPDDVEVQIGRRIRALRKGAGLTQRELGERLGVSFQQVQRYERGQNRIHGSAILGVCATFRITPNELLSAPIEDLARFDPAQGRHDPAAFEMMRAFSRISSPELRRSLVRVVTAAASAVDQRP